MLWYIIRYGRRCYDMVCYGIICSGLLRSVIRRREARCLGMPGGLGDLAATACHDLGYWEVCSQDLATPLVSGGE